MSYLKKQCCLYADKHPGYRCQVCRILVLPFLLVIMIFAACNDAANKSDNKKSVTKMEYSKGTFGYDLAFLQKYHKDLIVLSDEATGARLIVLPAYQGRVMTSTADGDSGISFGWVNHELIASGKRAEHINAFGGEDRFWLGPEGGQFSIFFKKGAEFTLDNWYVPAAIDTEPFAVVASTKSEAKFKKEMHLENYSGFGFDVAVSRTIRLLDKNTIDSLLGVSVPATVKTAGFESENYLTNRGNAPWTKKTGMLSIWILSMLNASDETTVAIPYKKGNGADTGKIVTDDYFGIVSENRLKVADGLILFKADAKHRSKIGVSPGRAFPLMAGYDKLNGVLTIAQFTLPGSSRDYVNSLWKIQEDPFSGDVINAYNDGPVANSQLGSFYEMESSSPAAALAPGETIIHIHRTIHLQGSNAELDKISRRLLGVGVDAIAL